MKFFQIFTLVVMVLSAIGSVAEKPPAKKWLIVLFAGAGLLFLAAWAMTNII